MAPNVIKKARTFMKSATKSQKPKTKTNKLPKVTYTNGGGSFPWVVVGLAGSCVIWCVVLVSSGSAAGNRFKERLLERYLSKGMCQS